MKIKKNKRIIVSVFRLFAMNSTEIQIHIKLFERYMEIRKYDGIKIRFYGDNNEK